jgi:hypothetical protein
MVEGGIPVSFENSAKVIAPRRFFKNAASLLSRAVGADGTLEK